MILPPCRIRSGGSMHRQSSEIASVQQSLAIPTV
jgi:hypothetical protein